MRSKTSLKLGVVFGLVVLLLIVVFQNMHELAAGSRLEFLFWGIGIPHIILLIVTFLVGVLAGMMGALYIKRGRK